MILSSKPKPVNFRIVLNNTEITSLESLRKYFDLERLLVNDRTQLISWLKRIDRTKSEKIEALLNQSDDALNYQVIIKILNIIYEQEFADMIEYVDYLYKNCSEESRRNYIRFISMHGEMLHELFPLDNIPSDNNNLNHLLLSLRDHGLTKDTTKFLSQLYYRRGEIQQSQEINPSSWDLQEDERMIIQEICSGCDSIENALRIINSNHLSIIGTEFIFLCALGCLVIYQKNIFIKNILESIYDKKEYAALRNNIGEFLNIYNNRKENDFYLLFQQLGYTNPNVADPLFNEKLFLTSLVAKNERNAIMDQIIDHDDYFPAHFLQSDNDYQSEALLNQDESLYSRWFKHILDYHDHPQGIDGDEKKNAVREEVIMAHIFKLNPDLKGSIWKSLCKPKGLNFSKEKDKKQQERIQRLQNKLTSEILSNPPELTEIEEKYVNFYKQASSIIMNLGSYFARSDSSGNTFVFTRLGTDLISDFESSDLLRQEKLFIVVLFYIIRYGKKNNVSSVEKELKTKYVPLKALFLDMEKELSDNDKKILDFSFLNDKTLYLNSYWSLVSDYNAQSRYYLFRLYLDRWIANFIYYINPNPDEQ